jgi:acyl dehydratase
MRLEGEDGVGATELAGAAAGRAYNGLMPVMDAIEIADRHHRAPVRIGDTVEARVTVAEIFPDKNRVALKTTCTVGETVVIDGDALVMVPSRQLALPSRAALPLRSRPA